MSAGGLPDFLRVLPSGDVSITCHVKPGAKICSLGMTSRYALDVAIDAPPREGAANAGVVEYVAEALGIKKRSVSLAAGAKSREKVLIVSGVSSLDVLARLQAACE